MAQFNQNWSEFEISTTGKAQSPVNISTSTAIYDEAKAKVQFNWGRSDSIKSFTVKNDGMTAYTTADKFEENTVVDGTTFLVHMVNYHWSAPGEKSSEHALDGVKYDGEIEVIHMKSGVKDFNSSFDTRGNNIVVSIFFQEDPTLKEDIKEINDFKSFLSHVVTAGTSFKAPFKGKAFHLQNMLPGSDFFRYTGSITVTPCSEGIERILFKDPLRVTSDFLAKLRTLEGKDGKKLASSANRNLQALNDRTVYKNFQ